MIFLVYGILTKKNLKNGMLVYFLTYEYFVGK